MPSALLREVSVVRPGQAPALPVGKPWTSPDMPTGLRDVICAVNARHQRVYDALAEEYDAKSALHEKTTLARVERLAEVVEAGKVIDVGCGVGLALSLLSKRGFQVTGVDVSPRMARIARRNNRQASVIRGDFLTADVGCGYDVVWEQALIHLFPKVAEDCIFDRFNALLKPGGVLTLSTTFSAASGEGWRPKLDYRDAPGRYRRSITEEELDQALDRHRFESAERWIVTDPVGKDWLTVIARKKPS